MVLPLNSSASALVMVGQKSVPMLLRRDCLADKQLSDPVGPLDIVTMSMNSSPF